MSPRSLAHPPLLPRRTTRRTEALVYTVLWLTVTGVYLLNIIRVHAAEGQPLVASQLLLQTLRTLLPYFLLFELNNALLIPRLLLPGKTATYFGVIIVAVAAVWGWQYMEFEAIRAAHPRPPMARLHPQPLIPLPLFLDCIYTLLVVGANLSVALLFRRFEDRIDHEQLRKVHAEERLASLRAQLNPHFYMNMLNNIHGMIEIDPAEAQGMVLDMSALMRYSLYESRSETISFAREIEFLARYIGLMRRRYPESRVAISPEFPTPSEALGVKVPPLIFLVFIENAFKHGVSYRTQSSISVTVKVAEDGSVQFDCINTLHSAQGNNPSSEERGIGLDNVTQRLGLTYGGRARLSTAPEGETYHVHLTLPPAP